MTQLEEAVAAALKEVEDPELPTLSVVDLGMVSDVHVTVSGSVQVRMLPTFVGCPALQIIEGRVRKRLLQIPGVEDVDVSFRRDAVWTTERMSELASEKLKTYGIASPPCRLREREVSEWVVPCPYCGSEHTRLENLFGPTACRSVYFCADCREPFEVMKPV